MHRRLTHLSRFRWSVTATTASLTLLLAGCVGSDAGEAPGSETLPSRMAASVPGTVPIGSMPAEPDDTTNEPSTTVEEDDAPEEDGSVSEGSLEEVSGRVLDAVGDYWDAILVAGDPPDPDHPELARHLTGRALERSRAVFAERAAEGLTTRNMTGITVEDALVDLSGADKAEVRHCFYADEELVDVGTGEVVERDNNAVEVLLSLVVVDDSWKVEDNQVLARGEEGQPC